VLRKPPPAPPKEGSRKKIPLIDWYFFVFSTNRYCSKFQIVVVTFCNYALSGLKPLSAFAKDKLRFSKASFPFGISPSADGKKEKKERYVKL